MIFEENKNFTFNNLANPSLDPKKRSKPKNSKKGTLPSKPKKKSKSSGAQDDHTKVKNLIFKVTQYLNCKGSGSIPYIFKTVTLEDGIPSKNKSGVT